MFPGCNTVFQFQVPRDSKPREYYWLFESHNVLSEVGKKIPLAFSLRVPLINLLLIQLAAVRLRIYNKSRPY